MPARTPTRVAGDSRFRSGGFGGFTPNPSIPYPGGRVVASDVQQAADAMDFGGMPTAAPRTLPTARPTATPTITMDPSGAGYASPGLNADTLRSLPNERFVGNAPSEASTDAPIPSRGGRSPTLTTDPNEDWIGDPNAPAERPTVAANDPNGLPTEPGIDESPLFEDPGNRPSVTITPGGGQQRTNPTYQPGGRDIAGFGGNMTLAQFLTTPLAFMRFGTDRYQQPVGRGTVTVGNSPAYQSGGEPQVEVPTAAATAAAAPGAADVETPSAEAEARGAQETAALRASGQLSQSSSAPPLSAVLAAYPSLNNPAGVRAIQSGANPADLVGHAQFDSHAAGLMEMAFQSFGGSPNNTGATTDEGHTIFNPAHGTPMGRFDTESGRVVPSERLWDFSPANKARAGQDALLYQAAVNANPVPSSGFDLNYLQKINAWLVAHNQTGDTSNTPTRGGYYGYIDALQKKGGG